MPSLTKVLQYGLSRLWILPAVIGLVLVFATPAYQSPDEQTHLYRSYQLSEGHLFGKRLTYGAGDTLPASLSSSFESYRYLLFDKDAKVSASVFRESIKANLDRHITTEVRFENTMVYPPLSYAPQVVAISMGKVLSAGPLPLLYLARIAVLATWIAGLYFMMRRHAHLKLPLFAFSMVPIVLFQSASASADMVTATASIMTALEIIRAFRNKINRATAYLLVTLSLILGLSKFPYAIVLIAGLILPMRQFETSKLAVLVKSSFLLSLLLSALWVVLANNTFVNLRDGVDTTMQLSYIAHNPLQYAHLLYTTFLGTAGDTLLVQLSGVLGWLDTKVPLWICILSLTSVFLGLITTTKAAQEQMLSRFQRIAFGLILISSVLIIATLLYLTWCPPGATVLDGLQGRYFIPLFGLLVGAFGGLFVVTKKQLQQISTWIIGAGLISGISTVVIVIGRYYV